MSKKKKKKVGGPRICGICHGKIYKGDGRRKKCPTCLKSQCKFCFAKDKVFGLNKDCYTCAKAEEDKRLNKWNQGMARI